MKQLRHKGNIVAQEHEKFNPDADSRITPITKYVQPKKKKYLFGGSFFYQKNLGFSILGVLKSGDITFFNWTAGHDN